MKKNSVNSEKEHMTRVERLLRYLRQNTWVVLLAALVLVALILLISILSGIEWSKPEVPVEEKTNPYVSNYICADVPQVPFYDEDLAEIGTVSRGTAVTCVQSDTVEHEGVTYYLTYLDELRHGYVAQNHLTTDSKKVVKEKKIYVRTPQNLRLTPDGLSLGALVEQGTELIVTGYDRIDNGVVHLYTVRVGSETGYISGQYTSSSLAEATEVYDRFGVYMAHAGRGDVYGGGDAESLDYYPRAKADFPDNPMPDPCYGLYLTCDAEVIGNIDAYIAYADSTNINTFVVNIMDGTSIGYPSEVYEKYAPTTAKFANNSFEEYQTAIQKIKDAGYYVVGRLTTFNDSFFVTDHPEYAICDEDGDPLYIANSYWPSPYCRYVWEYKVELAREAVKSMGFDEIQFDYVRFPDGTYRYEESGNIDYHNEYDETKVQAIQRFLMYAADELHDVGVYVGADVFGETNNTYVTSYGQYWPAISNVVDVISGMPYPDHFAQNGSYRPWQHPYETVLEWSKKASERQAETPTPAVARTWIQAYDAIRYPYNVYGSAEIGGQIRALDEGGLTGGFMAWHAACNLNKLQTFKPAFDALS